MALAWPGSPQRRADVIVGGVYVIVQLWGLFTIGQRVLTGDHFHGRPNEIASYAVGAVFQLLCAIPGIGVMLADRRGFVLTLILSGMGFLGGLTQWLLLAGHPSIWSLVLIGFDFAVAAYCAARLRAEDAADEENQESRPNVIRSLDVAAGVLNILPLVWIAGEIYMHPSAPQPRPRAYDFNPDLFLGGLALLHLLLCLGVALGRRGAFVAMVIWLGLVLWSESQFTHSSRTPFSVGLAAVVLLQCSTLAYSVIRSRKDQPLAKLPQERDESEEVRLTP